MVGSCWAFALAQDRQLTESTLNSPEQATEDSESVGPATDVFALGALICYMLTGSGPFGTGSHGSQFPERAVVSEEAMRGQAA